MGKSSPSPPPAPDPVATAQAQAQANTSTAASQAALNYVNQNTPYGSTNYSQTGSYTNPDGQTVPTYTQNVSLSPLGQNILTGQENVTNTLLPAAQNLADTVSSSISNPLNFNTADSGMLNSSPQLLDQQATNALYNQQKGFLDPQWDQTGQELQDQLSRQGIPVGSDAYNNAMKQFNNSKTQAYQSAQDTAIGGGQQAAQGMFGMALQGQQQNIAQQQLAQEQPLSLLQSLFGASPGTPAQPIATPSATGISPTDTLGAQALSTNAAMQGYQGQLAATNANNAGTASLIGTGLTAGAIII